MAGESDRSLQSWLQRQKYCLRCPLRLLIIWSASLLLKKNALTSPADRVQQSAFLLERALLLFLKTLDQIMAVRFAGHRALVLRSVWVSSTGWWCPWPTQLSHTEEPGAMFKTCCWLLLLVQSDGFVLSLMCVSQREVRVRKMVQTVWILFLVGYIFLR